MYINVYKNDFIREFRSSTYSDNFSRDALDALFEYFQGVESDTGEQIELDIVAIACDWSELALSDALHSCGLESLDELHDHTRVVVISGGEAEPADCNILMANY